MAGSPLSTDEGHLAHGFLVPDSPGSGGRCGTGMHLPGGLQTTERRQWDWRHQVASCPLTLREQVELLVRCRC